jgi:AcrR family transcriptional regulator
VEDAGSVIPISLPASEAKPQRPGSAERERIVHALAELCAERSYAEVSEKDIFARARIPRTTFYELFRDKEDCFLAAYDATLARFLGDVISACTRPGLRWHEQVRVGLETILSFAAANPLFARLCMVDVIGAGPAALERSRSGGRVLASFIDAGRAEAADGDHIPPGLASSLVGGVSLVIRDEILADRTRDLPALLPELLYSILVPYLGRERALAEARGCDALATASVSRAVG